jgi:hypothetical protein
MFRKLGKHTRCTIVGRDLELSMPWARQLYRLRTVLTMLWSICSRAGMLPHRLPHQRLPSTTANCNRWVLDIAMLQCVVRPP